MKLCIKCLRELFDRDEKCDICGNTSLFTSDDINRIRDEIISTNMFRRKKLLEIQPYKSIHKYLTQTMGEGYWSKSVYTHNAVIQPKKEVKSAITVECPYCHSSNTKKITNTSKAIHTAMFGVFSISRNSKEWHCCDCNSDF